MLLSSHKCVFSFYRMEKDSISCITIMQCDMSIYQKSDKDKESCVVKLPKGKKK